MQILICFLGCVPTCKSDVGEVEAYNSDFIDVTCAKLEECGLTGAECDA